MNTSNPEFSVKDSHLGKATQYTFQYDPSLLFPISRTPNRTAIQVPEPLPFVGYDIWNAYELSWLNNKGKPQVAVGEFIIPHDSPNIVESKSIKLYLNSLNNTKMANIDMVAQTIKKDLSNAAGKEVSVRLSLVSEIDDIRTESFTGTCIDGLDVEIH
ncbi:MAG: hypothetical protein MRY83_15710, partial [Flavobacteriales bacterium]|nr:hypothetical protein [Flavobacteriales bacterium]